MAAQIGVLLEPGKHSDPIQTSPTIQDLSANIIKEHSQELAIFKQKAPLCTTNNNQRGQLPSQDILSVGDSFKPSILASANILTSNSGVKRKGLEVRPRGRKGSTEVQKMDIQKPRADTAERFIRFFNPETTSAKKESTILPGVMQSGQTPSNQAAARAIGVITKLRPTLSKKEGPEGLSLGTHQEYSGSMPYNARGVNKALNNGKNYTYKYDESQEWKFQWEKNKERERDHRERSWAGAANMINQSPAGASPNSLLANHLDLSSSYLNNQLKSLGAHSSGEAGKTSLTLSHRDAKISVVQAYKKSFANILRGAGPSEALNSQGGQPTLSQDSLEKMNIGSPEPQKKSHFPACPGQKQSVSQNPSTVKGKIDLSQKAGVSYIHLPPNGQAASIFNHGFQCLPATVQSMQTTQTSQGFKLSPSQRNQFIFKSKRDSGIVIKNVNDRPLLGYFDPSSSAVNSGVIRTNDPLTSSNDLSGVRNSKEIDTRDIRNLMEVEEHQLMNQLNTIGNQGSRQGKKQGLETNQNKNLHHFKDVMHSGESKRHQSNNSKVKGFAGGYFPQNDYKGIQSPKKKRRVLNIQDSNDEGTPGMSQRSLEESRDFNQNELRRHQITEVINNLSAQLDNCPGRRKYSGEIDHLLSKVKANISNLLMKRDRKLSESKEQQKMREITERISKLKFKSPGATSPGAKTATNMFKMQRDPLQKDLEDALFSMLPNPGQNAYPVNQDPDAYLDSDIVLQFRNTESKVALLDQASTLAIKGQSNFQSQKLNDSKFDSFQKHYLGQSVLKSKTRAAPWEAVDKSGSTAARSKCPKQFQGINPENFNRCVQALNTLLRLTLRNKNVFSGPQQYDQYLKILKATKLLGLPSEVYKKEQEELFQFLRTKDFLVLIRVRMHQILNSLVYEQFNIHSKNDKVPIPKILKNHSIIDQMDPPNFLSGQQHLGTQIRENQPFFKFYTDQTGNNHELVRKVLKRRGWYQRIDGLKGPNQFDQTSLFWTQWKRQKIVERLNPNQIYAKIEGNQLLTNKANLLSTMTHYFKEKYLRETNKMSKKHFERTKQEFDPFGGILPPTYNLKTQKNMSDEPGFIDLMQKYSLQEDQGKKLIWICKPGENSNRGKGIVVLPDLKTVQRFLQNQRPDEYWVVQYYIWNPLLIGGPHWFSSPYRKFDIRVFALAQIVEGYHFRGYFYKEGYVRTSSYQFNNNDLTDRNVHLTNDAVQIYTDDYSKYEPGNKVSFKDFQNYLWNHKRVDFDNSILPKIKEAIKQTLEAFWIKLQHSDTLHPPPDKNKTMNQFEMLGYDFIIDENMQVYLIEVNTNPCLDTEPCSLLQRLITQVVDQTFKIAVDPFLRGRDSQYAQSQEMSVSEFNYELVYSNAYEISKFGVPNRPACFSQKKNSTRLSMLSNMANGNNLTSGGAIKQKASAQKSGMKNKCSSYKLKRRRKSHNRSPSCKLHELNIDNPEDEDLFHRDHTQYFESSNAEQYNEKYPYLVGSPPPGLSQDVTTGEGEPTSPDTHPYLTKSKRNILASTNQPTSMDSNQLSGPPIIEETLKSQWIKSTAGRKEESHPPSHFPSNLAVDEASSLSVDNKNESKIRILSKNEIKFSTGIKRDEHSGMTDESPGKRKKLRLRKDL